MLMTYNAMHLFLIMDGDSTILGRVKSLISDAAPLSLFGSGKRFQLTLKVSILRSSLIGNCSI